MKRVVIHDPTLRDGQHAVRHQLGLTAIRRYAEAADAARIPVVEVGHGNGLGASSLQVGLAAATDDEMLSTVREALRHSRMGAFMLPGWGTSEDLRRGIGHGVDVFRIGVHATEASLAERHLGFLRDAGAEAHCVLMMSHMASPTSWPSRPRGPSDTGRRPWGSWTPRATSSLRTSPRGSGRSSRRSAPPQ